MSEAMAETVVIDITKVELKAEVKGAYILGKDKAGSEYLLTLRPDTKIRRITPFDVTRQLGEFQRDYPSGSPFRVGQEVLVAWRLDPKSSRKVAIKITVFE
jgi:hypothetical protein